MGQGWIAELNGVKVCGGDCDDATACLLLPPDGLGATDSNGLRTEDQSYPQRDGVDHFSDWYNPRLITLTALVADGSSCSCTGSARQNARDLMNAWSRACDDDELVLIPPCQPTDSPNLVPNGSFTVNTTGWAAISGSNTTIGRSTSVFRSAPASLSMTAASSGAALSAETTAIAVMQGARYQGDAYLRAGATGRKFQISLEWINSGGSTISDNVSVAATDTTANFETHLTVTSQPPTGAVSVRVAVTLLVGVVASGEIHYLDDVTLTDVSGDAISGPFGAKGRARVAQLSWRAGRSQTADSVLRFDATDQRLYVLDADGAPGSGTICSFVATAPDNPDIFTTISAQSFRHFWPLDSPNIGEYVSQTPTAHDLGTNPDSSGPGIFLTAPAISYTLSQTALGPGSVFDLPSGVFASYAVGMVGWWQEVQTGATTGGAQWFMDGNHFVGIGATTNPSATWAWSTSPAVAMPTALQDVLGYTTAFRDVPVLVIISWSASAMEVNTWDSVHGSQRFVFPGVVTALPSGSSGNISAGGATFSSAFSSFPGSTNTSALATTLGTAGAATSTGAIPLPPVGDLCVPATITFTGHDENPSLYRTDGDMIGLNVGNGTTTIVVDTDAGTALENGVHDRTSSILGDPFLTVAPGETLYAFGGGKVQVCFRPAVLSA